MNHWKYTRNQTFLRQVSFPLLRAIAAWWTCWLAKVPKLATSLSRGELHEENTWEDLTECTRENRDPNAAGCVQNGDSAAPRKVWSNRSPGNSLGGRIYVLTNLAPIPTAIKRESNTTVLLPQEEPHYFAPGNNPLQCYTLYPEEQIGLSSPPALLQTARDTVTLSNAWGQMSSFQESFPAAVRAAVDPSVILGQMVRAAVDPSVILGQMVRAAVDPSVILGQVVRAAVDPSVILGQVVRTAVDPSVILGQMDHFLASRMPPMVAFIEVVGASRLPGQRSPLTKCCCSRGKVFCAFSPCGRPTNVSTSSVGLMAVGALIASVTHSPNLELRAVNVTVTSELVITARYFRLVQDTE